MKQSNMPSGFVKWCNKRVPFGKHKGCKLKAVVRDDFEYVYWAVNHATVDWFRTHLPRAQYLKYLQKHLAQYGYNEGDDFETTNFDTYFEQDYTEEDYDITAYDLCVDGW